MKSTDTDAELTLNEASWFLVWGREGFIKGEQRAATEQGAVKTLLSGLVTEERV